MIIQRDLERDYLGGLELEKEMKSFENLEKKKILQGFFKTGVGQYGHGDVFLGINVPVTRLVCSKYELDFSDIEKLLLSEIHEFRVAGLFILVRKFEKEKDEAERKKIVEFMLSKTSRINNWDLVDLSAPKILGKYLIGKKDRSILYKLAKSDNLWERRIAVVSTYSLIKNGEYSDTLRLSQELISDKQDLMHKAVGWMLREVGKKDEKVLVEFLEKNCSKMPRTALRYSIERMDEKKRKYFMRKKK